METRSVFLHATSSNTPTPDIIIALSPKDLHMIWSLLRALTHQSDRVLNPITILEALYDEYVNHTFGFTHNATDVQRFFELPVIVATEKILIAMGSKQPESFHRFYHYNPSK